MLTSLVHYFYPELNKDELKKFGLLSVIFFIIIGTYWLLRLLKNTIFLKVAFPVCFGWDGQQGCLFQPIAKAWSPFVVLLLVLAYSKLVDLVKKHQLFYIFSLFYAGLFGLFSGILFVKDVYGVDNVGRFTLAAMGWLSYFAIESFGSLVVALFWSFSNSITDSDSAKHGFPLIIVMAQISAVLGSSTLFFSGSIGSLWPIMFAATLLVLSIIPLVRYFMAVIPSEQLVGNVAAAATEKKKEGFIQGFFSGLFLLVSQSYLLGVLVISTIYEAVSAIVEYQMNVYATMSPSYQTELAFAQFQSTYGMSVNLVSFLIALLGTSYIINRFGTRISLLIYPVIFGATILGLFGIFSLGATPTALLWATFGAMVIIKGVGYAVNNPTKEMMYIPTSKDAKFKSKGWIDTFGGRFSKAAGARVTNAFKHSMTDLMLYGSLIGVGMVSLWLAAAIYVGYRNMKLRQTGQIIE